jgi:hypothetical protein
VRERESESLSVLTKINQITFRLLDDKEGKRSIKNVKT